MVQRHSNLWPRVLAVVFAGWVSVWPISARSVNAEAPFLADSNAAMARMMTAMAIRPSGQIDTDFAAMMISHHQGAIEMAEAELRYGHNSQLRRIAQGIVVEQQQEIVAMRFAQVSPHPQSNDALLGSAVFSEPNAKTASRPSTPVSSGPMILKPATPR